MKVVFTIPGDKTKYAYPTGPEDVTFSEFAHYLDNIYPTAPKVLKDIDSALADGEEDKAVELNAGITSKMLASDIYPYFAKVVAYFTKVSFPVLIGETGPGMNVKNLEALYNVVMRALSPPDGYEYEKTFEFNGATWEIPDRLMENASVIEFAEAAQYQASMAEVEKGYYHSLIDVCAVLVRKPGEKYSDNVYKRNKNLFQALPLSIVWQIAFFLMRQSEKLSRDFQIYTASLTLARLKRELETSQKHTAGT